MNSAGGGQLPRFILSLLFLTYVTDGRMHHILWNTCWFGSGENLGCKRFWFVIVRGNATLSITSLRQHGNSFMFSFSYSFGMLAVVLVQKLQCVPLNALTRLCSFLSRTKSLIKLMTSLTCGSWKPTVKQGPGALSLTVPLDIFKFLWPWCLPSIRHG